MRLLARTAKNVDTTSLPKKRNAASAAGGPPPGPENRPIGQGTPPRAQRRGWAMPAPAPGAQNGQPPDPRTAAGNSTMAANMAWPRAPVRPRVPKAPA